MHVKSLHSWNLKPKEAISIQNELRQKIEVRKWHGLPKLIAAADVAFKGNLAVGAVVVLDFPEFKIIEQIRRTIRISYPYIPGLLTFREGPVLEKCFRALKNEPEVIFFDGQGLAHPRNMGLATHMGILLDKSTIGCAKTRLYGKYSEPDNHRGAFSYLFDYDGNKVGVVLRTRQNIKPIYVSVGHKIDIESSLRLVLLCTKKFRLPEPIRLAHHLTQEQS
jgi:deoxyribonuclease V